MQKAHPDARRRWTPLRHSLRWRLPASFTLLLGILVALYLWAMYREVEQTIVRMTAERAISAAREVSEPMSRAVGASLEQNRQLAENPAVRRFVRQPNEATRAAAIAALPATAQGLRRLEIRDTTGALLLEIASPSSLPVTRDVLRSYPDDVPLTRPGISPIRAADKFNFFTITTEIRDTTPGGMVRLGYLTRYGQVSISGLTFSSLVGDSARVRVGSTETGVWTDMVTVVDPPPAAVEGGVAGLYRGPDGSRWIGGEVAVDGAPWSMWIGFPEPLIMAPARELRGRLAGIALLLIAVAGLVGSVIAARMTRPLHNLAIAAEDLSAGDYSRRVRTGRRDEIGRVAEHFNSMAARIQAVHDALRDTHEQTEFALAAARIGVWDCDVKTRRMRCSDSMRAVLPLGERPLPRSLDAFLERVHPDDRDVVRNALEGRVAEVDSFPVNYRAVGPDHMAWIEGKARVKYGDNHTPLSVLGVSMDVTARHRLEAQFQQAQKMEAVGQLAGGIAHDFNNLLTAIIAHANLILTELAGDAPVRDDVSEILHAAESAAALTAQLLTFSRRKLVAPRSVNIHEVISNTQRLVRRLVAADIEILMDLQAPTDTVRIDPGQLEQIIVNLVVNARDAIPAGGRITIATSNVYVGDDRLLEGQGLIPGRYVVLSVNDTGTGMDAKTQRRIFEPFFTTKPQGKGTGLGLATVFGITRQSGGDIYVYSEPNEGTTIKLYLPVSALEPVAPTPHRKPEQHASRGGETILVVEDNPAVRGVVNTILRRAGYVVVLAESGDEALRILDEAAARPDLVLTDVVMPGITGAELYREISNRYADIPVLFTSGYTGESLGRYGVSLEETLFIEKPYSPQELLSKVREALTSVRNIQE